MSDFKLIKTTSGVVGWPKNASHPIDPVYIRFNCYQSNIDFNLIKVVAVSGDDSSEITNIPPLFLLRSLMDVIQESFVNSEALENSSSEDFESFKLAELMEINLKFG